MGWDPWLDTGSGDNGFIVTFFSLFLFLSLHVVPLCLFFPSDGLSCAAVPVILPLHVGKKQRRLDNRPTFLSLKKKKKTERKEKKKPHQHKQMRPCTAWRTSSSLMDTSCPSIQHPPPPLPQPLHPHPARLPHPPRRPTANTMKSWRTCLAPGQWTATKEGPWCPIGMVAEPGSHKRMVVAVPTTTMNPGTEASPGVRGRTGAKLTPTRWESR